MDVLIRLNFTFLNVHYIQLTETFYLHFRNTEAPLSVKNILHGDIQENMTKTLITAVEKYIRETQRFFILSLCE